MAVVAQLAKRTAVNRNASVHRVGHGIFRSRAVLKTPLLGKESFVYSRPEPVLLGKSSFFIRNMREKEEVVSHL